MTLPLAASQPADIVIDSLRLADAPEPIAPARIALTLMAEPNPATSVTTLRFTLPATGGGAVHLEIFDLRGRRIADLSRQLKLTGTAGTAELQTKRLPQGVYYVLLHVGDREGRLKLAVFR